MQGGFQRSHQMTGWKPVLQLQKHGRKRKMLILIENAPGYQPPDADGKTWIFE